MTGQGKVDVEEQSDNDCGDPVDLGPSVLTRLAKIKSEYAPAGSTLSEAYLWSFSQPVNLAPLGLKLVRRPRSTRPRLVPRRRSRRREDEGRY